MNVFPREFEGGFHSPLAMVRIDIWTIAQRWPPLYEA
jgi:hypothetical protein